MKRFAMLFALLFIGGVITDAIAVAQDHQGHMADPKMEKTKEQTKEVYSCPMHPEVVSDKPGRCPKCGMKLQKVAATKEKSEMRSTTMKTDSVLGRATYEKSVDGLHVQVWVITQEEHKRLMSTMMKDSAMSAKMKDGMKEGEMKHDMGGMMHGNMKMKDKTGGMMERDMKHDEMGNKKMMENMTSGTHHIKVVLTEEKTGDRVKNADVEVATLSPSKKVQKSKLGAMMDHVGGSLELGEKGQHEVSLNINVDGRSSKAQFLYTVE